MPTLTTNWQNIAYYRFEPGTGFKCDYYLDAKYSTQDIANNTTTVQTRLRSVVVAGSGSAYGYEFTCSYCPTVSGSSQKWFATETITSGGTTLTHNDDGTKSVTLNATMKMTAVGLNASMSGTATMPRIQRYAIATSGTNFTDEEDPILTFSNVGLYGLRAKILVGTTEIYSENLSDQNATSYTYALTTNQRNQLRQLCTGQSLTVTLAICSVDTNDTILYTSTADVVMSIVNATPTFTYVFQEQNQNVIDLLGSSDATTLISNVSHPLITATFQTYKYATASVYNIKEGVEGHIIQSYSTPNPTSPVSLGIYATGINDSGKFRIRLVDSRGFETIIVDDQRTLLSYNEVKINNYSFKRQSPISSNVILNGDFNYWGNVGTYTNTPVVKYKLDSGSWVTIPSTNYTIDSTNHKLTISNYTISNILPYTSQGQFSISIEDALTSKQDTNENYGKVLKGVPTFDAGEHDLKVNGGLYVADINGDNAVNVLEEIENASLEVYSTTETIIGEWIDGKPLYRKVISGTKTTTGESNIALNTSNIDKYVTVDAKIVRSATETRNGNTTPYYMSSSDYWNYYLKTPQSNNLSMRGGTSWPQVPYDYVIILEYTKTTD